MYPINLYELTRLTDYDKLTAYEQHLSRRAEKKTVKPQEIDTIFKLIDELMKVRNNIDMFSGFFFSYNIPQIGQELDLIRISKDVDNGTVINIELKSGIVSDDEIRKQLLKNRYYLSSLKREIKLFSYTLDNNRLLLLNGDDLEEIAFEELVKALDEQETLYEQNIDKLFRVRDYIISPLNTPQQFLKDEYFLTKQQKDFKNDIISKVYSNQKEHILIGLTGVAGTGKTLLLYDIAKNIQGKKCIIHCGILSEGHIYLNNHCDDIVIIPAKRLRTELDFKEFDMIFVDECHRMHKDQFAKLLKVLKIEKKAAIFSYDNAQRLQRKEFEANIVDILNEEKNFCEYKLSNRIRTNKEIASFITKVMTIKAQDNIHDYPSVKIMYARTKVEADKIIKLHSNYEFIRYTPSQFLVDSLTNYGSESDFTTHQVIGQEYDNVIVVMDDRFSYNEKGLLSAYTHPNPDYIYTKMLFQALTRCREKLAIVIVGDLELFNSIFGIVSESK